MQSSSQPLQTDRVCFVNIEVKKTKIKRNKEKRRCFVCWWRVLGVLALTFPALYQHPNESSWTPGKLFKRRRKLSQISGRLLLWKAYVGLFIIFTVFKWSKGIITHSCHFSSENFYLRGLALINLSGCFKCDSGSPSFHQTTEMLYFPICFSFQDEHIR